MEVEEDERTGASGRFGVTSRSNTKTLGGFLLPRPAQSTIVTILIRTSPPAEIKAGSERRGCEQAGHNFDEHVERPGRGMDAAELQSVGQRQGGEAAQRRG